jgi:hypothetical protein
MARPRIFLSMKSTIFTLLALFCFVFAASAADVSGKWTAQLPGRGGAQTTTTFTFNVSGDTLTGTVQTPRGENPISDGKIDGDIILFVETLNFNGNEVKVTYTGTVKSDTIEFTRTGAGGRGGRGGRGGGGRGATFTATRAS